MISGVCARNAFNGQAVLRQRASLIEAHDVQLSGYADPWGTDAKNPALLQALDGNRGTNRHGHGQRGRDGNSQQIASTK